MMAIGIKRGIGSQDGRGVAALIGGGRVVVGCLALFLNVEADMEFICVCVCRVDSRPEPNLIVARRRRVGT